jgi:hypothetical protein
MDEVNVAVMAPMLGRDLSFVTEVDPRVRGWSALAGRPPRPELTGLPQILLTPHISGSGDTQMAEPLRRLFADNLRLYLDGQPLINVVDRVRGY